jgi:hypothetical protein
MLKQKPKGAMTIHPQVIALWRLTRQVGQKENKKSPWCRHAAFNRPLTITFHDAARVYVFVTGLELHDAA